MKQATHYNLSLKKVLLFCFILLGQLLPQQSRALWAPIRECKTEIKWERFVCILPRGATEEYFFGEVNVYNAYTCTPMDYYIAAVDPVTGAVNGTVTPYTGPLGAGWNAIYFSYDPDPGVTAVRFLIVFTCGGKAGYKVCRTTLGEYEKLDNRDLYPCRDYFKKAQANASVAAEQPNMVIAPNPAGNQVQISYDIPGWKAEDTYNIVVTNLMGQTVAKYAVNSNSGQWQYDASQLSSGTYLVQLVKDGVHADVQRLIVTH